LGGETESEDYERKSIYAFTFTGTCKLCNNLGDNLYTFRPKYEHDVQMIKKVSDFKVLANSIEEVLPQRFKESPYTPLYDHLRQIKYVSAVGINELPYIEDWINKLYILINNIDLGKLNDTQNKRVQPYTKPNSYENYNVAIGNIENLLAVFVGIPLDYNTPRLHG
jgi:hypothetical protein